MKHKAEWEEVKDAIIDDICNEKCHAYVEDYECPDHECPAWIVMGFCVDKDLLNPPT